jgi:hypothetical protein
MKNVRMRVEGTKLLVIIDLADDAGLSKSGKNLIVGTTAGNIQVPGFPQVRIGLTVFKPKDAA